MTNVNVGTAPNDGLGDNLRNAFIIVNNNFAELLALINEDVNTIAISGVTGLQTILNQIDADITALENDVDYISGYTSSNFASVNASLTSINNTVTGHTASINTINGQINTINSTLIAINNTITEILNDLNNLTTPSLSAVTAVGNSTTDGIIVNNPYGTSEFATPYFGGSSKFKFATTGDGTEFPIENGLLINANIEEWLSIQTSFGDGNGSSMSMTPNQCTISHGSSLTGGTHNLYLDDGGFGIQSAGLVGYFKASNVIDTSKTYQLPNQDGNIQLQTTTWDYGALYLAAPYTSGTTRLAFYSNGDGVDIPLLNSVSLNLNPEESLELSKGSSTGINSIVLNDQTTIQAVDAVDVYTTGLSVYFNSNGIGLATTSSAGYIKTDTLTDTRTYQLQDNDGIIALLSDIPTGSTSSSEGKYVAGWEKERISGTIVNTGRGIGKLLLTSGSTAVIGIGTDFTNEDNLDSPAYNYEATIFLLDGTMRFIEFDSFSDATNAEISSVYSITNYGGSSSSTWNGPTGEYEFYSYFTSQATGENSFASGAYSLASGNSAYAEGNGNRATGGNSHAEGSFTLASGQVSHAEGQQTQATNSYSHAEGISTKATGQASHSQGNNTTASGDYSFTSGIVNEAASYAETVIGSYADNNIFGTPSSLVLTDTIFRIGIGTINDNKDGFRVYKNGAMYIFPTTTGAITNGANGFVIYNNTTKKLASHDGTSFKDYAHIGTTAPASSGATGTVGEIRITPTFIYTCVATNTWVRGAMSSW